MKQMSSCQLRSCLPMNSSKNGRNPSCRCNGPMVASYDCSQVALQYEDGKMVGIKNVVVSTQHAADVDNSTIRSFITEEIIKPSLPADLCLRILNIWQTRLEDL